MNGGDVIEMKRSTQQTQSLASFLEEMSEDDLLRELDGPLPPKPSAKPERIVDQPSSLEANSRLTLVKMFETAPEMGQQFTFAVRRYCGPAYVQAMRNELSRARRYAKEKNYDMGEPFRMLVVAIDTLSTCDMVTVIRTPKGQKHHPKLDALAKVLGGSTIREDEDDD
jgi:hypothetical protein